MADQHERDPDASRVHALFAGLRNGVVAVSDGFRTTLRTRIAAEEQVGQTRKQGSAGGVLMEVLNLFVRNSGVASKRSEEKRDES